MKDDSILDIAGGTIVGRDHLNNGNVLIGKNNQDAFHSTTWDNGRCGAIIVADGCGSQPYSEVGSRLGVCDWLTSLAEYGQRANLSGQDPDADPPPQFWDRVVSDLTAQIHTKAKQMTLSGQSFTDTVNKHFLFTLVGAMWSPHRVWFYSFGDGYYMINDKIVPIEPEVGIDPTSGREIENMPLYVAYRIISTQFSSDMLNLVVHPSVPMSEVKTFGVGSDGIRHLIDAEEKNIPGKKTCLLYTSPSPRDATLSRMPSSA